MTTPKSTIKKVSLDLLTVDPNVQRIEGTHEGRVAAMAAEFDPGALGVITVSDRKGKYVVLDGMHRTAAARMAGYAGTVTAEVFSGLTIAQEAEKFLKLNSGWKPSALSKFHARYVMGEPAAVAITDIVHAHGWVCRQAGLPGSLAAIDALDRVYRNAGGALPEGAHDQLTDRVIGTITAAWEHDTKGVDAPMLLALAQLIGRFGSSIDDKKIIGEMQATRPGVLIGRAKTLRDAQGGTVGAALAKILAGMHNKGRRSNLLPDWVWIR